MEYSEEILSFTSTADIKALEDFVHEKLVHHNQTLDNFACTPIERQSIKKEVARYNHIGEVLTAELDRRLSIIFIG